jgi:DNA polymerase III sliding clamp (beta) subunit (PCNA family)
MKIVANAAELAQLLATAALALDAKSKIEVLGAMYVQADADGAARFVANAMDRVITVTAKTEVEEPGEVAVRAAALAGLVAGFPKDDIVTALSS